MSLQRQQLLTLVKWWVKGKSARFQPRFPVPTKKELSRFLGMVGYYRSFCNHFSTVVSPLTALFSSKVKFNWSPQCQHAFESVKQLLCSATILSASKVNQSFALFMDASKVGAGAVLMQTNDQGIVSLVSYFSRKFTFHELNYSIIEVSM